MSQFQAFAFKFQHLYRYIVGWRQGKGIGRKGARGAVYDEDTHDDDDDGGGGGGDKHHGAMVVDGKDDNDDVAGAEAGARAGVAMPTTTKRPRAKRRWVGLALFPTLFCAVKTPR
jgi:hypothetical protein